MCKAIVICPYFPIKYRTNFVTSHGLEVAVLTVANLAVTVALCGAGLDKTEIELVADPTLPPGTNASKLEVVADSGQLKLERLGRAMPDNPKTGVLTALTMADELMKIVRHSDW